MLTCLLAADRNCASVEKVDLGQDEIRISVNLDSYESQTAQSP